jgi:single-strand DNA-binding protein
MSYQVSGKIKTIKETETLGTKGFQKRLFVLEVVDGKFTNLLPLEFTKDKCTVLDNFSEGQEVTVDFNLRGSEYNGRYFLNAQAWKIEGGTGGSAKPASAAARPAGKPASKPAAAKPAAAGADEDVPW